MQAAEIDRNNNDDRASPPRHNMDHKLCSTDSICSLTQEDDFYE